MSQVILEITLHEAEKPQWAEWEMWRETTNEKGFVDSKWITQGTAPSFEAAVDHAMNGWRENRE